MSYVKQIFYLNKWILKKSAQFISNTCKKSFEKRCYFYYNFEIMNCCRMIPTLKKILKIELSNTLRYLILYVGFFYGISFKIMAILNCFHNFTDLIYNFPILWPTASNYYPCNLEWFIFFNNNHYIFLFRV